LWVAKIIGVSHQCLPFSFTSLMAFIFHRTN
jgi:hypothetical protein